jgi:hypothetical protein
MIVQKQFGQVYQPGKFLRVACASLFILPLLFLDGQFNVVLLGIAGATIYSLALFFLGAITSQDMRKLVHAIFVSQNR